MGNKQIMQQVKKYSGAAPRAAGVGKKTKRYC